MTAKIRKFEKPKGDAEGVVAIHRALISVSEKAGLVEFGRALAAHGVEIVSTGGTAAALRKGGVKVVDVSALTGLPEMLDGRVKTLHPAVHAGILAVRAKGEHVATLKRRGYRPVDLVVVNMYPFEAAASRKDATRDEVVEQIDIGGPAMIRSAAKNHESVAVIVNPQRFAALLSQMKEYGGTTLEFRKQLAVEAFARTAEYDASIAGYLSGSDALFPSRMIVRGDKAEDLRYGENPHQRAALYRLPGVKSGVAVARKLSGKELSYNNLLDADAAWRAVCEFKEPACVIVKHLTPCAAAVGASPEEAYRRAFAADPVSSFGGIVAFNRPVNVTAAAASREVFLEVVLAPSYEAKARDAFALRKNLRVLEVVARPAGPFREIRTIEGGFVAQDSDAPDDHVAEAKPVTRRKPTKSEWADLAFAWKVVKHVRSNAIVLAKNGATLGIGAGQTNRVGSVKLAVEAAGARAKGSVLASDAFFPFADGLEAAARAGVTAVIQPGGSVRDPEVVKAADAAGIAMVFTARRHFRH